MLKCSFLKLIGVIRVKNEITTKHLSPNKCKYTNVDKYNYYSHPFSYRNNIRLNVS